ncbi:MAG: uroporphyrinogen decarboxylase family protein [Chloroflexota bacterium]|nr:uroporphyrinogen decarboxylase family protein [Chloroflexota bacterium]
MNGRERIGLAMQLKEPDRVPVMCQLATGHYFLNTRFRPHEIWYTSEAFAEALVILQRRYRFDGILINQPGRPDNFLADLVRIEENDNGETLIWSNGDVTFIPWDDNAQFHPADRTKPIRADFETIDPDDLSGLDDLAGYIWNTQHIQRIPGKTKPGPLTEFPPYFFKAIDLVKALVGDEVSVHGEVFSPLTYYMELFGYADALMTFIKDPGKACALLDRLTEASVAWGTAQARRGVDAVLISSAFAGGPFLSPKMYGKFVVPYEKRVTDAIKAAGVTVYTHTCGSISKRLDLMLETGTMGIDTMDPPPLGNTELAYAKATIGDKVFLKGNMNSVELLVAQTEAEVIAHASERIREGMPGGGYILSTACSVSPRMEPWKLELLAPLAEELGRY